ncbi:uncharacterized protein LOC123516954 isoform X2 [Portunus trituberculatus]|uniref:uncharacterized protein LOC123516954 isoform X2 n=1 Tax=Portunus trituberculatus TaxID=210409 RepID=UPI001E1CB00D|nr:uncharacterized protein LOC123516954 isoform X2 [Portunus trituberculatus]XP_045132683.1 uncharacterized protein LOC123516954 isoform X2 [Portunus trituberculatus]
MLRCTGRRHCDAGDTKGSSTKGKDNGRSTCGGGPGGVRLHSGRRLAPTTLTPHGHTSVCPSLLKCHAAAQPHSASDNPPLLSLSPAGRRPHAAPSHLPQRCVAKSAPSCPPHAVSCRTVEGGRHGDLLASRRGTRCQSDNALSKWSIQRLYDAGSPGEHSLAHYTTR